MAVSATPPPPVPPPQPISTKCWSDAALCQRFRLQRRLGHGTYGTAWLARDTQTSELVVVKTVAKESTSRLNFKRELKYSHALAEHPHVIKTRRQGFETDDSFILIQEFANGGDLFECIRPELGMDEASARVYLGHICLALDYIHSRGLVHRDVKPENIVLCKTTCGQSAVPPIPGSGKDMAVAKLIDFGLTRRIGSRLTRLRGSLPYTAPEMCAAGRHHSEDADESEGYVISSELDIWSLGITLFCMLTGTFPWRRASESDSNFKAFAAWQLGLRPTPPASWRRFTPQLLDLFSKLLCIDPTRRATARTAFAYLEVPWSSSSSPTEPQSPHVPTVASSASSQRKHWSSGSSTSDVRHSHTATLPHNASTASSCTGVAVDTPMQIDSPKAGHQPHMTAHTPSHGHSHHHRSSWPAKANTMDHTTLPQHQQHHHPQQQQQQQPVLTSSSRRHSDSSAALPRLPCKVNKGCHTVKVQSTSQQAQSNGSSTMGHRPRAKSLWSIPGPHQPVSVT